MDSALLATGCVLLRAGPYHPPSRGGMVGVSFRVRPVSKTSSPLKSIYRKNHTLSLLTLKAALILCA